MILKTVIFVKRLVLIGVILIQEYKSIVNGLIKNISDKALYKLHLRKALKKNILDRHAITSK